MSKLFNKLNKMNKEVLIKKIKTQEKVIENAIFNRDVLNKTVLEKEELLVRRLEKMRELEKNVVDVEDMWRGLANKKEKYLKLVKAENALHQKKIMDLERALAVFALDFAIANDKRVWKENLKTQIEKMND